MNRFVGLLRKVTVPVPASLLEKYMNLYNIVSQNKGGKSSMRFGEKMKKARKEKGLSQEQFAELLNVSRSAVAKWESQKGMPDLSNLVEISNILGKSTDYFLKDNDEIVIECQGKVGWYLGKICNIELSGWNDGVHKVLVIGEDADFVYYLTQNTKDSKYGVLAKSVIVSIDICKTQKAVLKPTADIDLNYFIDKNVTIELIKKQGLVKGFFDFKDDDFRDVYIKFIVNGTVELELGRKIELCDISKIEEI